MIRTATGIVAALVLVVAPASAEWVQDNGPATGNHQGTVNANDNPISITQSQVPDQITDGNSVHCGATGTPYHTPNSYMRRFLLSQAHSINDAFDILSVDMAHEVANTDSGEPQPIDVNLYTIANGAALTFGALGSIGGSTIMIPTGTENAFENVSVTGTVADPVGTDLVVEYFSPDGRDPVFNSYYVGSNNLGQFGDSYLAAADCGITEPTSTAAIGFPGMHLIMVVNGKTGDVIPTEEASWGAIKALYNN